MQGMTMAEDHGSSAMNDATARRRWMHPTITPTPDLDDPGMKDTRPEVARYDDARRAEPLQSEPPHRPPEADRPDLIIDRPSQDHSY